jgi:DNA-binding transcriptional regulator/RsmH inhibitor MraZ
MNRLRFLGISTGGALLVRTVDPGNRVRLPPETADFIPWLKESSRKAIMSPGLHGGVQLFHDNSLVDNGIRQIVSKLVDSQPKADEAGTEWMRLIRSQITQCEVEFSEDRYGIVLPREFRQMSLLPNQGETAVVFVFGEVLEIWRADRWVEYVRDARNSILEVTERALDEIANR